MSDRVSALVLDRLEPELTAGARTLIGTDAFQECDALGLSRPVTKWNTQLRRAGDVFHVIQRAFAIATSGRPGPVLVDFPKDLQAAKVIVEPSERPSYRVQREAFPPM